MKIYTTKNQNSAVLNVADLLATIISSRDVAEILEAKIKETNAELVILDFSDIKFVSRSAAHSLLLLKDKFKNKLLYKKEVSFANANDDVSKMLRMVAANRVYPKNEKPHFNPERTDIDSLLEEIKV